MAVESLPRPANDLPDGWRMVTFGEMAQSITDRVDNPAEAGVERYVGLEHLDPETLHIHRWGLPTDVEATKLRFQPGDIIFGRRRAYQRKLAVADFEGICSAHALVLRARVDTVEPDFLPVFMQSELFFKRALEISVGSLSPTINWKTLAVQRFLLPPKPEQKRIAEILWAADAAVERWREVVAHLETTSTSASAKLFMRQAEVQTYPCDELCEEITVGIVVQPAKYYARTGVPALRSLNIFPQEFRVEDLVYLTREGHALHKKSELRLGDVVVVRTGRPGDAAVVTRAIAGWNCIDAIIVRTKSALRPDYLAHFLNSEVGRTLTGRHSGGTAQQHFNISSLRGIPIPCPAVADQDRTVELMQEIEVTRRAADSHALRAKETVISLRETMLRGVSGV